MKTTRTNFFKIGVGAFLSFSPLFVNTASASALKCSAIFAQTNLVTMDQITQAIQELSALRLTLDKAQAEGARSITLNFLQKDFTQKHLDLINYIEKYQIMTRTQLFEKIQQEIARLQLDPVKTDKAPEAAAAHIKRIQEIADRHNGRKMWPQRIEAGTYKRYPLNEEIVIDKPFEMMSTPTTQIVWRKVVELLNKNFHGKYDLSTNPSQYKNDLHPVEHISFQDVEFWLWGLNQLSQKGEPTLADIIEGHQAGDHYRLPRENEWEYVLHGQTLSEIAAKIDDYAWHYGLTTKSGSRPVGLKLPISKDGKDFYDLLGNISEMMDDNDTRLGPVMRQDQRPTRYHASSHLIVRGGHHAESSNKLLLRDTHTLPYQHKDPFHGFRLVRDIKESRQVLQQAPAPISVPVAPAKTGLWKKITGKLGW